jgi:hypothetical protein
MDVSTELALRLGFGPLRGDTINLELTNFFVRFTLVIPETKRFANSQVTKNYPP